MSDAEQELEALWAHVFGEPPSVTASPTLLAEILVSALPLAPPYAVQAPAGHEAEREGRCDLAPVYRKRAGG